MPSFGTTSALFARHFNTLRLLKRRVDLLKQSYYAQMDSDKSWEHVDEIITVMENGFRFLTTEEVIDRGKLEKAYEDPALDGDEDAHLEKQ